MLRVMYVLTMIVLVELVAGAISAGICWFDETGGVKTTLFQTWGKFHTDPWGLGLMILLVVLGTWQCIREEPREEPFLGVHRIRH